MSEINWTHVTTTLGELQAWDGNPKKSTKKQKQQIAASFDELGQFSTVAISPDGDVYDGHQRLSALLAKYGDGYEVKALQSSRPLTDEERRKIAIYSRQIGAWDWDALMDWNAYDLHKWGFDDSMLADLTADGDALGAMLEGMEYGDDEFEDGDAEPEISRADELRDEWGVETGQLWILPSRTAGQEHRLICGDCTDAGVVERLSPPFDMMFTDPPYGVGYTGGHFHSGDVNIKREREKLESDDTTVIYDKFLSVVLPHINGACYMWFADSKGLDVYNAVNANGCQIHALIIWHKTNAKYAAMNAQYKQRHEPCLYFKPKGQTLHWVGASTENTLWEFKRDAQNDLHPTQKPITLATKAIGNHDAQTVADFFCGSGSTIIAAENLSRQCRAVEISPAYVAVALQRYKDAFGITAVLQSSDK